MSGFDLWPTWKKYQDLVAHGYAPELVHDKCGYPLTSRYSQMMPHEPVFDCFACDVRVHIGLAKWTFIIEQVAARGEV